MFGAYFDESTASEERKANCYIVAGYVTQLMEWVRFEREWKKVLPNGPPFHASELEGAQSQFKYLKGRIAARRALQVRFAEATKGYGLQGVSVSVALKHHRPTALPTVEGQEHMNVPHMLAFRAFVQFVAQIVVAHFPRETVAFVCSDGTYVGRMYQLYNQIKSNVKQPWVTVLGSFTSHSWRESPPLQAADNLAYETFRYREVGVPKKQRPQYGILTAGDQVQEYELARPFYRRAEFHLKNHLKKAAISLDRP